MQRVLFALAGLVLAASSLPGAQAQQPRQNQGLPKVDFQIGQIGPLGQGIAIQVKNGGFAMSPPTSVSVNVHDVQSRRLLLAKSLNVPAMHPGQTRRVIVVPSSTRGVMVRAQIDPRNRVPETNERNNTRTARQ